MFLHHDPNMYDLHACLLRWVRFFAGLEHFGTLLALEAFDQPNEDRCLELFFSILGKKCFGFSLPFWYLSPLGFWCEKWAACNKQNINFAHQPTRNLFGHWCLDIQTNASWTEIMVGTRMYATHTVEYVTYMSVNLGFFWSFRSYVFHFFWFSVLTPKTARNAVLTRQSGSIRCCRGNLIKGLNLILELNSISHMLHGAGTYIPGWFMGKLLVNIPAPWRIWVGVPEMEVCRKHPIW